MKNEVATIERGTDLIEFSDAKLAIIKAQFFPENATPLEMDYCMGVSKALGLDPTIGEIYFVERKSKSPNGQWITKVQPLAGKTSYLIGAKRTGKLDGIEQEATIKDFPKLIKGEWVNVKTLVATAKVYEVGKSKPYQATISFDEYAQYTNKGELTKFWREKSVTMTQKVALKQALVMFSPSFSNLLMEEEVESELVSQNKIEPTKKSEKINYEPDAPKAQDDDIPVVDIGIDEDSELEDRSLLVAQIEELADQKGADLSKTLAFYKVSSLYKLNIDLLTKVYNKLVEK